MNKQRERSYQLLLSMNDRTYLAPYNHRTHLVTDVCPWGYQPPFIRRMGMAWGDHQTIIPLYNDVNKLAQVRIAKHRSKII